MPNTVIKTTYGTSPEGNRIKTTTKKSSPTNSEQLMMLGEFMGNTANVLNQGADTYMRMREASSREYNVVRGEMIKQQVAAGATSELQKIVSDFHSASYGPAYARYSQFQSLMHTNGAFADAIYSAPDSARYYTDITNLMSNDIVLKLPYDSAGAPKQYVISGGFNSLMNSKDAPERVADFMMMFQHGTPTGLRDSVAVAAGFDPGDFVGSNGPWTASIDEVQDNRNIKKYAMSRGITLGQAKMEIDTSKAIAAQQAKEIEDANKFGLSIDDMKRVNEESSQMIMKTMADGLSGDLSDGGGLGLTESDNAGLISAYRTMSIAMRGGNVDEQQMRSAEATIRAESVLRQKKQLRLMMPTPKTKGEAVFQEAEINRRLGIGAPQSEEEIIQSLPEKDQKIWKLGRDKATLESQLANNAPTKMAFIPSGQSADPAMGVISMLTQKRGELQTARDDATDQYQRAELDRQINALSDEIVGVKASQSRRLTPIDVNADELSNFSRMTGIKGIKDFFSKLVKYNPVNRANLWIESKLTGVPVDKLVESSTGIAQTVASGVLPGIGAIERTAVDMLGWGGTDMTKAVTPRQIAMSKMMDEVYAAAAVAKSREEFNQKIEPVIQYLSDSYSITPEEKLDIIEQQKVKKSIELQLRKIDQETLRLDPNGKHSFDGVYPNNVPLTKVAADYQAKIMSYETRLKEAELRQKGIYGTTQLTEAGKLQRQRERLAASGAGVSVPGAPSVSVPGVAQPTSQAEYDALPSGTRYIDPASGKTAIKP